MCRRAAAMSVPFGHVVHQILDASFVIPKVIARNLCSSQLLKQSPDLGCNLVEGMAIDVADCVIVSLDADWD